MKSIKLAGLALLVLTSLTPVAFAQNVPLGTAGNFGVLAASTVTNTGSSVISGSVGVYPGTSITGFPPGQTVPVAGDLHHADATAQQAQIDLTTAYNNAAGQACDETIAGNHLGGLTRSTGVYCLGAADLTGTLTLDGPGVYIFKAESSLISASNASVNLINGASACDVFWQVGSSATLGTGSDMAGYILAQESVTLTTGASLTGAAMARTGAVTLDDNNITPCDAGDSGPGGDDPDPNDPDANHSAIPTMNQYGLGLMALLMLGLGLIGFRRFS